MPGYIFVETGFHHVAQAALDLLGSSVPPASAFQSAGITDREIPGEGATQVASTTLLAGAALLGAECTGLDALLVGLGWSHPHKENSNWKR
ncbi:hypothetical protein AAY473_033492 [Plecturocebus cupreus]